MRRLVVLASVAAATGCAAAPKAAAQATAVAALPTRSAPPPIVFEGLRLSAYNGATRSWILYARRVGYDAPAARLDQMRLDSYEGGRKVSEAEAPAADLDAHSGILSMRGPVRVRSTAHREAFSADAVKWTAATGRLWAAGHVVFHRGVSVLAGARLEADSLLKRVRISGPVSATVSMPLPEIGGEPPAPGRTP